MNDIILPSSRKAEVFLIAYFLETDQICFDLTENDFYYIPAKLVFQQIKKIKEINEKIIPGVTLDFMKSETIDGFLTETSGIITDDFTASEYAKLLKEYSLRRKIIIESESLKNKALDLTYKIDNLTDDTEKIYLESFSITNNLSGEKDKAELIRPINLLNTMINFNTDEIKIKGVSTGYPQLDELYMPAKGTLNIFSGIPSHGKSSLMDAISLNISQNYEWKWCVFSPENYPVEIHLQKLTELFLGKNISVCTQQEIEITTKWIDGHYQFVKLREDKHSLNDLMKLIALPVKDGKFDALIIDPWNELDTEITNEKETDFIGRSLSQLRRFGRRNKIAVFIVAHPAKMYKNKETGKYDVPTLYDLAGSAHWYNRADNGLTVYRDFEADKIDIHVQKIKYKIHGKIGLCSMKYDRECGRFYEDTMPEERSW